MNIAISSEPAIRAVSVSEDAITAQLADSRTISVEGILHGVPARRGSR